MIHQNHLPLDQRRERARWKSWCVSGSRRTIVYFSCPRSSPAIEAARSVHYQTQRGHPSSSLRKNTGLQATTHTRLSIASPVLFPLYTCQFPHQISAPFFSEVFSFSLSKGSVDNRCGSMREKINSKLNCHDQYFVSLLPEQRLTKDRAIPSVPSIRCSGG